MRLFFSITILLLVSAQLLAQKRLYPLRVGGLYGLIDGTGKQVMPPTYQYISNFSEAGYAIAEKDNHLGVIDTNGQLKIPCKYDYLSTATTALFSAKQEGEAWKVISTNDEVVFDSMPGSLTSLWGGDYVSFSEITGVGLAHVEKGILIPTSYDRYETLAPGFLVAIKDNLKYLYDTSGQLIIGGGGEELRYQNSLIWVKRNGRWMAHSLDGRIRKKTICEDYSILENGFYILSKGQQKELYFANADTIVHQGMHEYVIFNENVVQTIDVYNKRGLIDWQGRELLPTAYAEITDTKDSLIRVKNMEKKYGVFDWTGKLMIPFKFDYIQPFRTSVALARMGNKNMVINKKGKVVIPAGIPSAATLEDNNLRFRDKDNNLQMMSFDEQGELLSNDQFKNVRSLRINALGRRRTTGQRSNINAASRRSIFQINDTLIWRFHDPSRRWGLWNLDKDRWKFAPQYSNVRVYQNVGISVVEKTKENIGGKINTGMLDIEFHRVYGIFANSHGVPVTRMEFLDIRMSDFEQLGHDVARVVFIGGRAGLVQRNGKIIARNYTYMGDFVEGKARIAVKGRIEVDVQQKIKRPICYTSSYYYQFMVPPTIDSDGDPRYYAPFRNDGRVHCIESKWGYIDTFGQVIVKPEYDFVENYSNGRAMIRKGDKWGMLDEEGTEVLKPQFDEFKFLPKSDQKLFHISNNRTLYGAVDTTGKVIVPVKFTKIRTYQDGRIAVRATNMYWGFLDEKSNAITDFQYRLAGDFSEGLAVVYRKNRWGVIDRNGNEVIAPQYTQMGDFSEGKAWVALSKGFKGYIDKTGKLLFKGKYARVTNFSQGVASVYIRKRGWGLIDTKGKIIMKPKKSYKKIGLFNQHGLAKVKIGNKYRLMNRQGELVGKRAFGLIREFHEGYAVIRVESLTGNKVGKPNLNMTFIDTLGEIIPERDFGQLQDFNEGRAAFRSEDGKRGYINTRGEIVIQPQYFKVEPFKDNRAVVYESYNVSGIIDTSGNEIIPVKYKRIVDSEEGLALVRQNSSTYFFVYEDTKRHTPVNFQKAYGFQNQMAPICVKDRWGLVNRQGVQTMMPKYADMKPFEKGLARVAVHRLQGVVDINGKVVVEPLYEYVEYVGDGLFRIEHGDKMGYFSIDGYWVKELTQ